MQVNPDTCQEAARDLPVLTHYDVLVCGGGPAGIAAAIASARSGARTGLLEVHNCLGGVWTAGALSWILDYENKPGIMTEILETLEARGARAHCDDNTGEKTGGYDVEMMKVLLDELCLEADVDVHLQTRVCAAARNENNRLRFAIIESRSGREAISADVFIDCTGDGDLAAQAGCGFDFGLPEDGATQPFSLMAIVVGLDPKEVRPYFRYRSDPWATCKERLKAEMERGGHSPSYGKPTLFHIRGNMFAMMANHEYEFSSLNARDITRATLQARHELHNLVNGLRSLGGCWRNMQIVMTGAQIGIREGRRVHGRYTVTEQDLQTGARHEDAVCRVTFGVDVHATKATNANKGIEKSPIKSQHYDIPLRALIAKDVDGLMMAGRNISGDFLAHASYRVTGNSVALGEAAGKVASKAAQTDRLPQEVTWQEVL